MLVRAPGIAIIARRSMVLVYQRPTRGCNMMHADESRTAKRASAPYPAPRRESRGAGRARHSAAALSAHAALSLRQSGFDARARALGDQQAGRAQLSAARAHGGGLAGHGDRLRGRPL